MRLTIPQPQLLKHLQIVEHVVNDRSTLPILTHILFQTTQNELTLIATDLDVGIQCRFPPTQPTEEGAVALPARKLTTIIRELPDDPITLEAKKNHTAIITCGPASFRIPGLPPEDFPTLPTPQPNDGVVVSQGVLKQLINQTAYAMSMEETRFILNGTLLSAQKESFSLVATDGRRLALTNTTLNTPTKHALEAVIPAKAIRELGRLLDGESMEEVTITPFKSEGRDAHDLQLTFRFGDVTLITRLIEGQFPSYGKVIPPPTKQIVTCNRQILTSAIRRASLMTTATSQAVLFELAENRLVVSKESSELGSAREELPVTYAGGPMTAAFNPEFWLDVLKVLVGNEVTIELAGPDRPAVIRQPAFTYVVLPMKVL